MPSERARVRTARVEDVPVRALRVESLVSVEEIVCGPGKGGGGVSG